MGSLTTALRTAATLFGLVCIAQTWRVLAHIDVAIAGRSVPFWPSGVAAVVTGLLSVWLFSLSRSR